MLSDPHLDLWGLRVCCRTDKILFDIEIWQRGVKFIYWPFKSTNIALTFKKWALLAYYDFVQIPRVEVTFIQAYMEYQIHLWRLWRIFKYMVIFSFKKNHVMISRGLLSFCCCEIFIQNYKDQCIGPRLINVIDQGTACVRYSLGTGLSWRHNIQYCCH